MCLNLQSDAIFIADSHFNANTARGLLGYLAYLAQEKPPSQLILMGDIAQVLIGTIPTSIQYNIELIEILQKLEEKSVEIIWLEGNHDFALQSLHPHLPKTTFIPRKLQPIFAQYQDKHYLLAHGDLYLGIKYNLYIRTLKALSPLFYLIDKLSDGEVYEEIHEKIEQKHIHSFSPHFFEFANQRIYAYKQANPTLKFQGIIEGHFHIGKKISSQGVLYISLPAFYFLQQGATMANLLKDNFNEHNH